MARPIRMQILGGIYHVMNRGPLFRGRYKSILIGEEDYFLQVVRYIHLNPVSAGIVKLPGRYRWSSHRFFTDKALSPTWLCCDEILEKFKHHKDEARTAFDKFILSGNQNALEAVYLRDRLPPILGNDVTIRSYEQQMSRPIVNLAPN